MHRIKSKTKPLYEATPEELAEIEKDFHDWVDNQPVLGSLEAAVEHLCQQHFAEPQQMEIQISSAELDPQSKEWTVKGVFENQEQFVGSPADLGIIPPSIT